MVHIVEAILFITVVPQDMGCVMIDLCEIRITNHHLKILASETTEKNVTLQEDPLQERHCFLPYQVSPPIPTHQEQVPEPYKWTEVGGLHHSLSGSEANQQEGSAFHRDPP